MNGRFFLDTNIFVYSFDAGSPEKRKTAEQLIRKALETHKGVVSYQVVQEFLNVALRRFAPPFQRTDAERYIATVFRPLLAIQSSTALYNAALQIHFSNGLSWYDSLIVSAAIEGECNVLFTEDLQHGQKFGSVEIANPFR